MFSVGNATRRDERAIKGALNLDKPPVVACFACYCFLSFVSVCCVGNLRIVVGYKNFFGILFFNALECISCVKPDLILAFVFNFYWSFSKQFQSLISLRISTNSSSKKSFNT